MNLNIKALMQRSDDGFWCQYLNHSRRGLDRSLLNVTVVGPGMQMSTPYEYNVAAEIYEYPVWQIPDHLAIGQLPAATHCSFCMKLLVQKSY